MNRILAMASKDIRLIVRDRMALFFIGGFPILMGLFFGLVMGNTGSSGSSGKMRVAIVDQDKSDVSTQFIESLKRNDNLELEVDNLTKARESVRKGRRLGMMVLPQGFGERAGVFWGDPPTIQLGLDPSRNAESAMLQGFIMQGIGELVGTRFQNPAQFLPMIEQSRKDVNEDATISISQRLLLNGFFNSLDTMIESADVLQMETTGALEGGDNASLEFANIESLDVSRSIDPNSTSGQLSKLRSRWDISFPQAMLWGVLSCVTGFAISIARERTQGTFTRLQVAPITTSTILAGKALACFLMSIAVVALMTVLGVMLGMEPHSYVKLGVASVFIAIAFTGIMMVMSVLGKTEQSVSGAGWAIMMVMAMLGGCMIPAMFLPGFLQTLSVISPVKWAIQSIEGAVWRQFTWNEMLLPLTVLLGTGVICFVAGANILKRQSV